MIALSFVQLLFSLTKQYAEASNMAATLVSCRIRGRGLACSKCSGDIDVIVGSIHDLSHSYRSIRRVPGEAQ